MPEDSSEDSLEWLSEGSPSSSSPSFSFPSLPDESPSETVELYRTVSWTPLAVVLLALALILQASFASAAIIPVLVLSGTASVIVSIGVVRRSQVEQEEENEADG